MEPDSSSKNFNEMIKTVEKELQKVYENGPPQTPGTYTTFRTEILVDSDLSTNMFVRMEQNPDTCSEKTNAVKVESENGHLSCKYNNFNVCTVNQVKVEPDISDACTVENGSDDYLKVQIKVEKDDWTNDLEHGTQDNTNQSENGKKDTKRGARRRKSSEKYESFKLRDSDDPNSEEDDEADEKDSKDDSDYIPEDERQTNKAEGIDYSDCSQFSCRICQKEFSSKYGLSRHEKRHQKKTLECDICKKKFHRKDELNQHVATHDTSNRDHLCDICGHSFNTRHGLRNHFYVVHDQRIFICKVCGKEFSLKQNQLRHEKSHEEKTECTRCHIKVLRLNEHNKVCRGREREGERERNFECTLCDRKFLENRYLKEHLRYKHGDARYFCPNCKKRFTHRKTFLCHQKKCFTL